MTSGTDRRGFVRVGKLRDLKVGRGWAYDLNGVPVAVFRTADGYVAISDTCPHMGTSLADGDLRDGKVECPWHHWKYDVESGRSDQREWACVDVFEVRVEDGEVFLKPPPAPEPEPEPARDDEDDDWMTWDPQRFFKDRGK